MDLAKLRMAIEAEISRRSEVPPVWTQGPFLTPPDLLALVTVAQAARRHCSALRAIPYDDAEAEAACGDVETALAALVQPDQG